MIRKPVCWLVILLIPLMLLGFIIVRNQSSFSHSQASVAIHERLREHLRLVKIRKQEPSSSIKELEDNNPVKNETPIPTESVTTPAPPKKFKNFLYMIETDSCLPEHMRLLETVGDPSACGCDILVLSFKSNCTDPKLQFPHVFYFFNSSTTWTSGRGELYYQAMKLDTQYLYYIFLDDDISPKFVSESKKSNPWRYYEQFLLKIEPPLAALDNENWQFVHKLLKRRKQTRCAVNGTGEPEYYYAKWFDGEVNAIHRKAIKYIFEPILPYWTRYDKVSWWYSQWYVNFLTDIVFPKQSVLLSQVFGSNPQHTDYPQKLHTTEVLQTIADDVMKVIPPEHQEAAKPILQDWVKRYLNIPITVEDTFCHPIPAAHEEIVPYKRLHSL